MSGARIQLKRATAASWASNNPVLYSGEIGLETDTNKFKIGDGSTAFNSLSYFNGNLTGSSLNDLADVTITSAANGDFLRWNGTAWVNDAVNLSVDTVGSYVESLVAGTGVTLSNNSGEAATPTVAIGQAVGTSASVTFAAVTAPLIGNASTATTLETSRTIELTGDVSGSASFNGSANASITATIQPNSVALGTDTTGNYVTDVVAGTGITVTHTPGEGSSASVILNAALDDLTDVDATSPSDGNFLKYVSASSAWVPAAIPTINNLDDVGDVTITSASDGDFLKWNGSAWVNDPINLGTDTVGNYMSGLTQGTGVTITHTPGEGSNASIAIGQAVGTADNPSFAGVTADGVQIGISASAEIDTTAGNLVIDSAGGTVTIDDNLIVSGDLTVNGTTTTVNTETINLADNLIVLNSNESDAPSQNAGLEIERGSSANVALRWNETSDKWQFTEDGSAYLDIASVSYVDAQTINSLDEIGDVSTASAASGDFLKWNGSAWVNDPINLGSDTVGNYVNDVVAGTGVTVTHTPGEGSSASIAIGQAVGTASSVTFADVTASTFGGYQKLVGAASSSTVTLAVTVASKTSNHRYYGSGSGHGYYIDGIESPFLTLLPGKTYRFVQSDASNSSHPLRFYLEASRTNLYTTNVTTSGTAGSAGAYTEITITDTTPIVLHYQCQNHSGMGNAISNNANAIDTPHAITARAGIAATGTVSATTFSGALSGNATTATALATSRTIELTGDVTGSASFDGSANASIAAFIAANSVALGTDTTGDYVASLVAGTGITLTNNSGETATPTIAIGQAVATNSNVTFNDVTVSGNLTVSGTTTTINTTTLSVADNIVTLNSDYTTGAPSENAGLEVLRGSSSTVQIRWNESTDKWQFTNDGTIYSDLGSGGATVSASSPASPTAGSLWFDSDTGQTFVYYDSYWVEIGATAAARLTISATAPSSPVQGAMWFDSDDGATYVYYGSVWVEIGASAVDSLLNTIDNKGDLLVGTADNTVAKQTVGTNGYVLIADSSTATGIKWGIDPTSDLVTTKGDIVVATEADTLARLGSGSNDQVLTVDTSTATGLKWSTPTTYATTGKAIAMAIVFG